MVKVKEIMKTHVATARTSATVLQISRTMWNNRFGSVVLCDPKKEPIGLATWSTVIEAVAKKLDLSKTKASELIPKNLVSAKEDETIMDVSRRMVKNSVDRMPVINSEGKLVGIVSYKDILASTPEMLNVLTEKLKATIMRPPVFDNTTSGLCEICEGYSDELRNVDGRWICSGCKNTVE